MQRFARKSLRPIAVAVPLAAMLIGVAGFGWGNAAAPARAADPPQVTVNITNFAYDPTPLMITPGTIVTWVQNDASRHSATDDNGAFDTGLMNQGGSGSIQFNYPGVYTYTCSIHPFMHGEIDVSAGGAQTTSRQKAK